MRSYFESVVREIDAVRRGSETFLANWRSEESTFVRFNNSAVRQPGAVREIELSVDLIDGRRHAEATVSLSGEHVVRKGGRFDGAGGNPLVSAQFVDSEGVALGSETSLGRCNRLGA